MLIVSCSLFGFVLLFELLLRVVCYVLFVVWCVLCVVCCLLFVVSC